MLEDQAVCLFILHGCGSALANIVWQRMDISNSRKPYQNSHPLVFWQIQAELHQYLYDFLPSLAREDLPIQSEMFEVLLWNFTLTKGMKVEFSCPPRPTSETSQDIDSYQRGRNWDLVGNDLPVFFLQNAIKFPDLIHAVKPEPDTGVSSMAKYRVVRTLR